MQFVCQLCGYIYDEEKESTAFDDLPADWVCPLCKAPKSMFKPKEVHANTSASTAEQPDRTPATTNESIISESDVAPPLAQDADGDVLARLNAGQLAALCGNLARGCEKQARGREAELFAQLADAFGQHIEPIDNANIDALAALLLDDTTARYADARARSTEQGDRGALRVITWGERITNMLKYLTDRYISEGETFLADTNVWVCTVCGFIYVGDEAPELCPVCKVPAWKFELIEAPVVSVERSA